MVDAMKGIYDSSKQIADIVGVIFAVVTGEVGNLAATQR